MSRRVDVGLTYGEVVVLFEMLHRWENDRTLDGLPYVDEAEKVAMWNLNAVLEPLVDEAFFAPDDIPGRRRRGASVASHRVAPRCRSRGGEPPPIARAYLRGASSPRCRSAARYRVSQNVAPDRNDMRRAECVQIRQ